MGAFFVRLLDLPVCPCVSRLGLVVFFLLALCTGAGAQAQPPQLAVIDFTGDANSTAEQLDFITGELASELVKTNAFVVLERGRMDAILQEQGFQQSGACNSSDCRVQVGQMLGVDKLVAGSLVRFGPQYAFRIEYLDVATGRILQTISLEKRASCMRSTAPPPKRPRSLWRALCGVNPIRSPPRRRPFPPL